MSAVAVDHGQGIFEGLVGAEWKGAYVSCLGQKRSFVFLR